MKHLSKVSCKKANTTLYVKSVLKNLKTYCNAFTAQLVGHIHLSPIKQSIGIYGHILHTMNQICCSGSWKKKAERDQRTNLKCTGAYVRKNTRVFVLFISLSIQSTTVSNAFPYAVSTSISILTCSPSWK